MDARNHTYCRCDLVYFFVLKNVGAIIKDQKSIHLSSLAFKLGHTHYVTKNFCLAVTTEKNILKVYLLITYGHEIKLLK